MNYIVTGPEGTIARAMNKIAPIYGHTDSTHLMNNRTWQYGGRPFEPDFTDKQMFDTFLTDNPEVDTLFHLGAYVGTDHCKANKQQVIAVNVDATRKLIELANKHGLHLVYFSTTAIYDPLDYGKHKPISKSTAIKPQTLYGLSKYFGEMLVKQLADSYTIVRPVFGFADYPDDLHSALTQSLAHAAMEKQYTILLSPTITKSYTRVENLAHYTFEYLRTAGLRTEVNIGDDDKRNWFGITSLLPDALQLAFSKYVTFSPQDDYLHYHHIVPTEIYIGEHYTSFEQGLGMMLESLPSF